MYGEWCVKSISSHLPLRLILAAVYFILVIVPASSNDWNDFYGDASDSLVDSSVWENLFTGGGERETGLTVFPLLELPLGGERAAMGGAYTAVARDLSGIEANPAGTATLPYTEIGVFHKNYIADTSVESAAGAIRFGDLGVGGGVRYLHVPFTGRDDRGRQTLSTRYSELTAAANVSYNFFRSYSFHGLSVGMNAKFAQRSVPELIAPGQSAASALVDLGMLTRFNFLKPYPSRDRNTAVGFAARNFGTLALGESPPATLAAGISYSPLRPLTLAFDTEVPVNLAPDTPSAPIAMSAGGSVQITDFFAAQTGVQLKGGNPRFSLGGGLDLDEVTVAANYTLDLTSQFSGPDNFTLEARFNFGDRGRAASRRELEDLYFEGIEALAAGNPTRAVQLLEQATEIDPKFDPAVETLENALQARELESQMEILGDLEALDIDTERLLGDDLFEDVDDLEELEDESDDGGPQDDESGSEDQDDIPDIELEDLQEEEDE